MSRFKSESQRATGDRDPMSVPEAVDGAASDGARSSSERPVVPPPMPREGTEPAVSAPASAETERYDYDSLWTPSQEGPATARLPAPPVEVVHHELPEDAALDPRLAMLRDPDSTRAASFRVLRHHLAEAGAPRVIAVSSPRERERKTTCAINLALALAESGQAQVLLVDANRFRPEVAPIFRFVPPRCFLAQLEAREDAPQRAWHVVDMPSVGLHVLGIDAASEGRPFVDAPAMTRAFEGLRLAGYDHIVIDASSVLRSADLNLLQDAVDAVLLTAVQRRTSARDLQSSVEQLTAAKILGTSLFER